MCFFIPEFFGYHCQHYTQYHHAKKKLIATGSADYGAHIFLGVKEKVSWLVKSSFCLDFEWCYNIKKSLEKQPKEEFERNQAFKKKNKGIIATDFFGICCFGTTCCFRWSNGVFCETLYVCNKEYPQSLNAGSPLSKLWIAIPSIKVSYS